MQLWSWAGRQDLEPPAHICALQTSLCLITEHLHLTCIASGPSDLMTQCDSYNPAHDREFGLHACLYPIINVFHYYQGPGPCQVFLFIFIFVNELSDQLAVTYLCFNLLVTQGYQHQLLHGVALPWCLQNQLCMYSAAMMLFFVVFLLSAPSPLPVSAPCSLWGHSEKSPSLFLIGCPLRLGRNKS